MYFFLFLGFDFILKLSSSSFYGLNFVFCKFSLVSNSDKNIDKLRHKSLSSDFFSGFRFLNFQKSYIAIYVVSYLFDVYLVSGSKSKIITPINLIHFDNINLKSL